MAAVQAELARLHPGAEVDSMVSEEDSTEGGSRTVRLRVDYSVGTVGYQDTLWTAVQLREGADWQVSEETAD